MYNSIDYVLGSYFSPILESSEDEGISRLKEHLNGSDKLKLELAGEVSQALCDSDFSALTMFEKYDIVNFKDENDARTYLKRILWDPYFDQELQK